VVAKLTEAMEKADEYELNNQIPLPKVNTEGAEDEIGQISDSSSTITDADGSAKGSPRNSGTNSAVGSPRVSFSESQKPDLSGSSSSVPPRPESEAPMQRPMLGAQRNTIDIASQPTSPPLSTSGSATIPASSSNFLEEIDSLGRTKSSRRLSTRIHSGKKAVTGGGIRALLGAKPKEFRIANFDEVHDHLFLPRVA